MPKPPAKKAAKSTTKKPAVPPSFKNKVVESSHLTNVRPRQPKVRKSPPRRTAPLGTVAGLTKQIANKNLQNAQDLKERALAAQASGLLPHEWMLAVMRGEPLNHFAYDSETQEIIEVIVLPTFSDRMEMARSAAPFYGARMPQPKPGDMGGPKDPNKRPGVMEVPLANSMEKWVEVAASSQKTLKKDVTK